LYWFFLYLKGFISNWYFIFQLECILVFFVSIFFIIDKQLNYLPIVIMKNFDMHFHSQLSDWENSPEEILQRADELWIELLTLTDHDRVASDEFILEANNMWMKSLYSTEISARNYEQWKSLHMTYYSQNPSDELYQILNKTINGKKEMLSSQIDILVEKWFTIDIESFYQYAKLRWKSIESLNKYNLSEYIFTNANNIEKIEKLSWKKMNKVEFFLEFLKEWGEYYAEFHRKIEHYEPAIDIVWDVARKSDAILSVAHPNITFRDWIEEFRNNIRYYLDRGVNAIELNSIADKKWLEEVYYTKNKYNLLLTAWSDNHWIWKTDNKHADFGNLNPRLNDENKSNITRKFMEHFE